LENADVNGDGTKLSPKVTPADAQSVFLQYLSGAVISNDCSGNSRFDALSSGNSGYADVSLVIDEAAFTSGQDVLVPVIIDSKSEIRAFGFDLLFPSDSLTFIRVERTDLTKDFDQLDAAVISQVRSPRERRAAIKSVSRILRVGGYKTHSRQDPSSGVLVTLIFRATGKAPDQGSLSVIATYDDLQKAPIKMDSIPERVRRPSSAGPTQPSSRRPS
jgi:hypothetical protein